MTPRPTNVRLARAGDELELFALICASDDEWSLVGERDSDKIRGVIWQATNSDIPMPKPIFGVIAGPSIIEGAIGLYPTEPWNSSKTYLRAFFHFAHPSHRKGYHGRDLLNFGKWFGERSCQRVLFELLHPIRLEEKNKMYGRHAQKIGALYMHDGVAA